MNNYSDKMTAPNCNKEIQNRSNRYEFIRTDFTNVCFSCADQCYETILNEEACYIDEKLAVATKSNDCRTLENGYLTLYDVIPTNCKEKLNTMEAAAMKSNYCKTTENGSSTCYEVISGSCENINYREIKASYDYSRATAIGLQNASNFIFNEITDEDGYFIMNAHDGENLHPLKDGSTTASVRSLCSEEAVHDNSLISILLNVIIILISI